MSREPGSCGQLGIIPTESSQAVSPPSRRLRRREPTKTPYPAWAGSCEAVPGALQYLWERECSQAVRCGRTARPAAAFGSVAYSVFGDKQAQK